MTGIRRGVMGTGIACHLANAGIESLLFDIVPADAPPGDHSRLARTAIATAAKPSAMPPLFRAADAVRIRPCNYDDDAGLLASCDWVVEVVTERLDIKRKVYQWVAANRRPGSIVSSNTRRPCWAWTRSSSTLTGNGSGSPAASTSASR